MAPRYPEDGPNDQEGLQEPQQPQGEVTFRCMRDATGVENWTPGLDNPGIRTVAQRAEAATNIELGSYSQAARGMFQKMLEAKSSLKRTFDHMDSAERNIQSSGIVVSKKFAPAPVSPPGSYSSEETVVGGSDWNKLLPLAVFSINSQIDKEIHQSFAIAFGHEPLFMRVLQIALQVRVQECCHQRVVINYFCFVIFKLE